METSVAAEERRQPRRSRKHRAGLHRIPVACERCRVRKNKCDAATPVCGACDRAGAECIVVDRLTHRPQARDHVSLLERDNARLRARLDALERHVRSDGTTNARAADVSSVAAHPMLYSTPSAPVELPSVPAPLARAALGQVAGNDTGFVGESGGSFFGDVVQSMLDRSGIDSPAVDSERSSSNVQGDGLTADRSAIDGGTCAMQSAIDPGTLPAELALRLECAFFDSRWPTLPFLHRPTFHSRHMLDFLQLRERASPASICFSTMVMAVGAIDLARRDSTVRRLPAALSHEAMARHHEMLAHRTFDLESVQMLILEALFAISEPCGIDAWYTAGQAVRVAIALGLHRESKATFPARPRLEAEMRRRIFWCAFAIDQNISLALGRPPAIRNADIDAGLPLCITDADLLHNDSYALPDRVCPHPQDTSTFVHIVRLRRLRARTQDALYTPGTSASGSEAELAREAIRKELDNWFAAAPRFDQSDVVTYQTLEWFQISYSQSLLVLYRPSPACPLATDESLKICHENAITFVTSYSSLYAKNKIAYTWLSLHSLFMASITMLYALWVSPLVRAGTSVAVARSNVKLCVMLFEVMEETWPLATRCRAIVKHIGDATLLLFERVHSAQQAQGEGANPSADNQSSELRATLPRNEATDDGTLPMQQTSAIGSDPMLATFPDEDMFFSLEFNMDLPLMTCAFDGISGD